MCFLRNLSMGVYGKDTVIFRSILLVCTSPYIFFQQSQSCGITLEHRKIFSCFLSVKIPHTSSSHSQLLDSIFALGKNMSPRQIWRGQPKQKCFSLCISPLEGKMCSVSVTSLYGPIAMLYLLLKDKIAPPLLR